MTMQVLEPLQTGRVGAVALREPIVGGGFSDTQFAEYFHILAAEPGGLSSLRQLVLDLAIRGRLVEHADEEDAVPSLLARIDAKRERLVSQRQARRLEEVPQLLDADTLFPIPPSWRWVRLGQATICRDGQRVPVSKEERVGRKGPYDYYGASGVIDTIDAYIFDEPLLLIGEDGANLLNRSTPIAFIASGKYWVNNHAHVLDSVSVDVLRYIAVFINAIDLTPFVTGTAQPKMNQAKMNAIPVALPPLAEQKRIVARVDQLMALIDELEAKQAKKRDLSTRFTKASLEALTTAESPEDFDTAWKRVVQNFNTVIDRAATVGELRAAILGLALSAHLVPHETGASAATEVRARKREAKCVPPSECPYALPDHWAWFRLRDVLASLTDGDHQAPPQVPVGVPFLTIGNVSRGALDFEGARAVPRSYFETLDSRRVPKSGDILYTVVGATYGRPVPVDQEREFCVQRHIAILRPDGTVDREYLYLYLQSRIAYDQARKATTGTAQPTVPLKPLRDFMVPVPPLAEQKRIVAKVEHLMKLCDELEAKLRRAEDRASKLVEAVVQEMVT